MPTMKSAISLKYLTLPKSSHSFRPMALQYLSCATIPKRQTDTDLLLARTSVFDYMFGWIFVGRQSMVAQSV
jgi:hypothetical protein